MAYTLQEVLKDEESALRLYFDDIADSTPLSREKEVELSAKIHAGDQEARDELVQANLRFVIDVAKKYQNRGLSLSDLISAGNVGLMTAATRFDGEKGFKFISYAVWWIKQSILQTIAEHARTVRLPLNKLSLLKDISKASRKLGQGRETDPHVDEIAKELDMAPEDVLDTMMHARTVRSLDESFEEDDERSLMNILRDDNQATPDLHVMESAARNQLDEVLESLDEREFRIIRLYFGLDGNESMTLEEIGGTMNLTRERVRQLKERALGKLRHPQRYQALLAICDDNEVF
ncbi:MAG: RNA polymerase sigma factor RpoD/SigA [Gemmatimonadetes bacterium]|jgi:RNA polymerase primary sigma factor|nr:RNA polymerase sigma factor RpoD/SigA [Gemmatimonadota bacterium]MBT5145043.1 RNA polymerase sigma factor RpoD/SigA [Gemmatimonadota bacterium]MBT5592108.1 RNA polymerase sigma factor RpoD/SigA [Gemmatimonadota bacterium]MBT5964165.1 RNA polymerase sigma factor RpoD/SigA [Gemmatimonadota bacterium]MBT6628976.1 RNA polymerase sigma factor RpoD/SigA [Gemmatimonadota bacterium]